MPFINDKLNYYQEQQRKKEYQEQMEELKPTQMIKTRFTLEPFQVVKHLRSKIIGQVGALLAMENMLNFLRADIFEPDRPLYVGIFLGPTGVGKTEMVKALSEAIHGNRESFCRVDMNTLSQDHYAAALTGAPPGYVGSKESYTIFDKEKIEGSFSKPGIVMFDEVEKASQQVIQTLLNIFDNGIMTMAAGQTIDFRNAIIIMTGNLGARELYKIAENQLYYFLKKLIHSFRNLRISDSSSFVQNIVKEQLEKKFSPEFINRIDDIIIFDWLSKDVMGQVLELHVQQLNQRLKKHNASLIIEDSAIDFLVSEGFNRQFGVRALKRTLHKYLEVPLAEVLLKHPYEEGVTYVAKYTENMCIESASPRNLAKE